MKLRTLTIIILAILVIAGFIFYFLSHRGNTNSITATQSGTLPGATTQSFTNTATQSGTVGAATTTTGTSNIFGIVSNDPTLDYFVDGQNTATIIEPNGSIETITNGATTVLSSTTISNLITASFSYDGKKILVSSGSSSNPQTSVFAVASHTWLLLPQNMQNPVWSPTGYQVAYTSPESGGMETIFTATISTTTVKTVALKNFAMEDSLLQWPNKNTLIISDKPSAFTVGSALMLNITTKALTPIVVEYPGMETIWSKTIPLTGLVFSGNSGDQGGNLSLINTDGTQNPLTFATLPSKCLFNTDTITTTSTITVSTSSPKTTIPANTTTTLNLYCAIPQDQNTFSIARLPDEYDQKIFFTSDNFSVVNTVSGVINTVFSDPNQTLDATDLKIFNGILLFVNRYDQKLYAIKLQ